MARTALTVQSASRTGTVQAAEQNSDVANGNSVANSGRTVILARNSNAGSTVRNVTIAFTKTVDGQAITSITVAIAAGATAVLGRYSKANFGSVLQLNADNAEVKFRVYEP